MIYIKGVSALRAKVRLTGHPLGNAASVAVLIALLTPSVFAAGESTLGTVTVTGAAASGAQKDQKRLQKVAGNTAVIDNRQVEQGRAANAEDVLALQPGVFAQGTSGTAANKISIRGSGLNTFYQGYVLGTKFLFDGLPITGPGGTQEDFLDMQGIDHTEVLYGGNASEYAALSLGGAINFVSKTGRTDPGNYARFEVGSYGYRKQQLSTGGVVGDSDYYINVLHNERDGYQDQANNEGRGLAANFGHVFSPKLETRLFVKYREEQLTNGNTLTRQQLKHDPRSNSAPTGRHKDGTTFIGNKTTYTFDDGNKLEVGASYNNYPLLNGWRYSPTPQDWRSKDINLTLRYFRTGDRLFGLPSDSSIIFSNTRASLADVKSHNRSTGARIQKTNYTGSRDTVLTFGNELQLTDALWLSSGLSFVNIRRKAEIEGTTLTTANTSNLPTRVEYVENDLAPRLGLRYQINPEFQLFGNVSRSIDPPVTWQLGSTGNPFLYDVRPQKATTFEVGVRGSHGIFDGSLTLYRSWVQDELLTVVVRQASATQDQLTATSNASPTIHQGIEAGLNALLWTGASGDTLDLRQAYTLNDFKYRDDDTFGGNELPSLPRQVYQAELAYRQASGFYASLNLRAASSYYIDYANTWQAPSYLLWGAKVGFQAPSRKWEVFADLRNLTDQRYASAANTAYNANGRDSANFYPGDAFSVTTGVAVRF